jgi:hypothetical protein
MPSLDAARARARLSGAHLDVLARLLDDRPLTDEVVTAATDLHHAGLVVDGVPVGLLADLVRDLAAAEVTLDVEVQGRDGTSLHGAVLSGPRCWTVTGWPGEEESEYARIDPRQLGSAIALTVGIEQRAAADVDPLTTTVGVLDAMLAARGAAEAAVPAGADLAGVREQVLAAIGAVPGASPDAATVLVDERAAWRITAAWRRTDPPVVRGLAVIDARPTGYWVREQPAEPLAAERLVPSSAADLWRRIGDLLPGRPGPTGAGVTGPSGLS